MCEFWLQREEFDETLELLRSIDRKVDKIMADIVKLQEAVANLETAEAAAAAEMVALSEEVATLTAGEISQEQIDALTEKATNVADALTAATTAAQAGGEPPAPTGGGEEPAPPAPEGEGA